MFSWMRFSPLFLAAFASVAALVLWLGAGLAGWWALAGLALTGVGVWDLVQSRHAVRRNYPILGHLRYLLEFVRPELRQYFLESDSEAAPFSRQQRAIVYQRAKAELDKRPFGTHINVYEVGYEWINHSVAPVQHASHDFRVEIGGPGCTRPYSASIFNISAMSYGALSANAVRALNKGARMGRFAHDTGEGGISRYHREFGGDLIWEIGSGYFGCRDRVGGFDPARFAEQAGEAQVRMIEIKLSQGAKPGHGGVLPGAKVSAEIAAARGVPQGADCISPASHSAFSTPIELLQFVARLRELSGGKPVGFKLAIGHPWEWFAIAKAMLETGITPDFVVVDGKEGGTGAAPAEFIDHVGAPMRTGLLLVHNTLVGLGLRERVQIGAAGKIITGFDIARTLALGANWCNSARGFMFALGCIQSQHCHTGACPTGVASQEPSRQRALVVPDKSVRVCNFHQNTLRALSELVGAAGLAHPREVNAHHIVRRVSPRETRLLSNVFDFIAPGALLDGSAQPEVYRLYWPMARADSFAPAP